MFNKIDAIFKALLGLLVKIFQLKKFDTIVGQILEYLNEQIA